MRGEIRTITCTFMVKDHEQLPGDVVADDVIEAIRLVIQGTLTDWYAGKAEGSGSQYLVCEPDVV